MPATALIRPPTHRPPCASQVLTVRALGVMLHLQRAECASRTEALLSVLRPQALVVTAGAARLLFMCIGNTQSAHRALFNSCDYIILLTGDPCGDRDDHLLGHDQLRALR